MSATTNEKYDNETKNLQTLKYNISHNTDIFLDDFVTQILISSIKCFRPLARHT